MEMIQNRHDSIKQKNKIFFIIFIFFTVIAFVLRFLLTIFEVDPHSNLYVRSSPLLLGFDYSVAVVVLFILLSSKFMYKEKIRFVGMGKEKIKEIEKSIVYAEAAPVIVQGSQTLVFTSSLTGFLLIASSILQVVYFISDPLRKDMSFSSYAQTYIKDNTFDFILFFIAILGAVYFFKTASINPNADNIEENPQKLSQGYMIFSFFPIIWSFLNIFKCFFDMSKSVNSPIRMYELVCFLSISLYFVAESRLLVGKRETAKFFSFGYTTMLLIALSALPNLILSAFWILETSTSIIIYGVQISFFLYIAARIYSQIKYGNFALVTTKPLEKSESEPEEDNADSE